MDICYLCGLQMVEREVFLLDASKFEKVPKFKHAEHIIQNALYGRLKSAGILCETCGGKLGDQIDADFVKIFSGFTTRMAHLLAPKDHGKVVRSLRGEIRKHNGEVMEVDVVNGRITPKKPSFDYIPETNTVKIYAKAQNMPDFKGYVIRKLEIDGVDLNTLIVELYEEIKDYDEVVIPFSEGVENFNEKFNLGLNKIATGFAIHHGVDRNDLPGTLDTTHGQIIVTENAVPFYPLSTLDYLIEPFRIVLEDEFPTHTLMLFTDRSFPETKLVCYIDLFSTFQHYVILNHDYKGETINTTYYQTIIKQEKPAIDIRGTRWKYLGIIADDLGVDRKEMSGMTVEQMYDFLEKKHIQLPVSYLLDINETVEKIAGRVSMNLLIRKKGISYHLSSLEQEILEAIPDLEEDDLICLHAELHRIETEKPELFYKKEFIAFSGEQSLIQRSTLHGIFEFYSMGLEPSRTYGHSKFIQLEHFVHINEPRD